MEISVAVAARPNVPPEEELRTAVLADRLGYGFRPGRRAQDAIAEILYLSSSPRNYEWIVEADIEACFDRIDHAALMGRVRGRIGDKRVLSLVKAFLRAGIMTEQAGLTAVARARLGLAQLRGRQLVEELDGALGTPDLKPVA
jgi:hypothetical protein